MVVGDICAFDYKGSTNTTQSDLQFITDAQFRHQMYLYSDKRTFNKYMAAIVVITIGEDDEPLLE